MPCSTASSLCRTAIPEFGFKRRAILPCRTEFINSECIFILSVLDLFVQPLLTKYQILGAESETKSHYSRAMVEPTWHGSSTKLET